MTTVETTAAVEHQRRTSTAQKVGLVLAGLLCLTNLPSAFSSGAAPGEVGPPTVVLVACTVLAVVGLGALVPAWRSGHPVATRVLAACLAALALASVPGLFVQMPPPVKAAIALTVVVSVVAVVLLFRRDRPAARD